MSQLTDYQIRRCIPSDYKAIYKLNATEMGYDYPEEETEKRIQKILKSEKDRVFVAIVEDEVVGYIHACDYDVIYAPSYKNIMGIAVCSDYKRNGIGKALLSAVEEWAKCTGAVGVRLNSGATRVFAHRFYKNCGYVGDKEQIRFIKHFK